MKEEKERRKEREVKRSCPVREEEREPVLAPGSFYELYLTAVVRSVRQRRGEREKVEKKNVTRAFSLPATGSAEIFTTL